MTNLSRLLLWIIVGAAVLLAPGRASGSGSRGVRALAAPRSGTITFADWQFPDELNPVQSAQLPIDGDIDSAIFAGLLAVNPAGHLVPDLLARVPSFANHDMRDDGKTIVLHLRPHQYWSSGVEITNRDILFGWKIEMDPVTGPACKDTCDHIGSISLAGRYTAILHMKRPYGPVLTNGLPFPWPHSWPALGPTPHAAALRLYQDPAFTFEDARYWTDGPFQVREYVRDDHILLAPMKYYHVHHGPRIARLLFRFYSSRPQMIQAAEAGQIDISAGYTEADFPLVAAPAARYRLTIIPSSGLEYLVFNSLDRTVNGAPNPLHHARVRQALALAVNRMGLIETALQVSSDTARDLIAATPLLATPHFTEQFADRRIAGAWDPLKEGYISYGPTALRDARALLRRASPSHGPDLAVYTWPEPTETRLRALTAALGGWPRTGVSFRVQTLPRCGGFGRSVAPLLEGNFNVVVMSMPAALDPDSLRSLLESRFIWRRGNHSRQPAGCYNAAPFDNLGVADSKMDRALERGLSAVDPRRRAAAYRQVQERLIKEAYWVPLYYPPKIATVDRHVQGFADTPYPYTFGSSGNVGGAWQIYNWRYVP